MKRKVEKSMCRKIKRTSEKRLSSKICSEFFIKTWKNCDDLAAEVRKLNTNMTDTNILKEREINYAKKFWMKDRAVKVWSGCPDCIIIGFNPG